MAKMTAESQKQSSHASKEELFPAWQLLREGHYFVGHTRVRCWMCACLPKGARSEEPLQDHRVILYGEGVGLMEIRPTDPEDADEIFALLTKYSLSLYHVEDVLEDREISATIRMI